MSPNRVSHALVAWAAAMLLPASAWAVVPSWKSCCLAPAGTVVSVELAEAVSTKAHKAGDPIRFRLAAPLVVQGMILVRAGAPVTGEVVEAVRPGAGGKGARLVLSAKSIEQNRQHVPLQGLELAGAVQTPAAGASSGGEVTFPAGAKATAKLASAVVLPALASAPGNAQGHAARFRSGR